MKLPSVVALKLALTGNFKKKSAQKNHAFVFTFCQEYEQLQYSNPPMRRCNFSGANLQYKCEDSEINPFIILTLPGKV